MREDRERRPYVKPEMTTGELYETNSYTCTKTPDEDWGVCSLSFELS